MLQDVPRLQPAPHARGTGGTCRGETFQSFGPSGERVRRSPAVPGEQRLGLGTWTRPHLRGPARGARPERGRASARAEPSGNGQTAAREDVGRRRSREWCPTPASVGWALLAVAQSGPERLPGVPGRLPTAAPCPGGSAGHRQPGTLRVCVPAPLGWCGWPLRPASSRALSLRLPGTTLNYKGCDYYDISLPCSACSGVKGSVLERVRGAAIHKGN